jgi:N-acetylmuramoyl-L-alanine amidase
LQADGIVGPATEAKIRELLAAAPPAAPPIQLPPVFIGRQPDLSVRCVPPPILVDRFIRDSSALTAAHAPVIDDIAASIVASHSTPEPVHLVCLIGHTDASGDAAYNQALGQRRAETVREALRRAVEARSPGLSTFFVFEASSRGETAPAAPDTFDGQARNRRVEVFLNNRWLPDTPAQARITVGGRAGATLQQREERQQAGFDVLAKPGSVLRLTGTGSPLPPGPSGFTWTTSNPNVAVPDQNCNTTNVASVCSGRAVNAGTATLTLTYEDFRRRKATDDLSVLVADATVSLNATAPTDRDDVRDHELSRPTPVSALESNPATRTATIQFRPATFFRGREITVSFRDDGAVRGALPANVARLEAVPGSPFNATTGRATLNNAGAVDIRINMPPVAFNRGVLEFESVDVPAVKSSWSFEVPGVVIIDPGHGGADGGAVSVRRVTEATMTLDLSERVSNALRDARPRLIRRSMTRAGNVAVAIPARPGTANQAGADVFLSIHFNSPARTRGVMTFFRDARANVNFNEVEDRALAQRIQAATVGAMPGTRDLGVLPDTRTRVRSLGVLNDRSLGNTAAFHPVRSALLEVEFLTNRTVDNLFNFDANRDDFKNNLAAAIAGAIIDDLANQG